MLSTINPEALDANTAERVAHATRWWPPRPSATLRAESHSPKFTASTSWRLWRTAFFTSAICPILRMNHRQTPVHEA